MPAEVQLAVVRHADALAFHAAARPVIERNEVEAVALEVAVAGFLRNPPPLGKGPYLATVTAQGCVGAAYLYGGQIVALGASDAAAAAAIARDMAYDWPNLTGAIGAAGPCAAFLAEWGALRGGQSRQAMHFRQHVLGGLQDVSPPPGGARCAAVDDFPWLMQVQHAAATESGMVRPRTDWDLYTLRAIEAGRYWIWDNDGPVSYAGWAPALRPAARIAPVGTPADQRGKGYATALTAALVRSLLESGRPQIVLSTDATAAIPNAIYARLGFRPVSDAYRFEIVPPAKPFTDPA